MGIVKRKISTNTGDINMAKRGRPKNKEKSYYVKITLSEHEYKEAEKLQKELMLPTLSSAVKIWLMRYKIDKES